MKTFIRNKNIIVHIYRIQAYNSIISGYFCVGYIDFMFKSKTVTDFTNLFLPHSLKGMSK